jgi:signal peptidase I
MNGTGATPAVPLATGLLVPERIGSTRRVVAVLASLLIGVGAGHLTVGPWRRGMKWYLSIAGYSVAALAILALFSVFRINGTLAMFFLVLAPIGAVCLYLAAAIDVARTQTWAGARPNWKRVLLGWLAFFLVFQLGAVGATVYRLVVVQAFRVPSGSMMPAFLVGDHFLVSKASYWFAEPRRGDVIVFRYPVDESRDFIKRVIAVGGEELHINGQKIFVNCKPTEPHCQPITDPWAMWVGPSTGDQTVSVKVPANSYFVLRDNRNNSQDSRHWGFIRRDKIKGRAYLIYWSWDSASDGSIWEGVRWNRIGMQVE